MTDRHINHATHRGHTILKVDGAWLYADTREPVASNPNRECGTCGRPNAEDGHDGCLGTLPGVANACCGHGEQCAAYVQFDDGRWMGGVEAVEWIGLHKSEAK